MTAPFTKRAFRCLATALMLGAIAAHAETYAVIIAGSGGTKEYKDQFHTWATGLRTALVDVGECDPDGVRLLVEEPEPSAAPGVQAALDPIRAVFEELAGTVKPEDELWVFLIGHGSYLNGVSKFNLPGPDLTAAALDEMLEGCAVSRVVVVNGASSSAGFINVLSKPGRVIVTATKSVEEKNAPRFVQYLVESLQDGSADRDRDTRISVLEACEQAAVLSDAWYNAQGLLATEHALLDDNGDGLGSRLPLETEEAEDGAVAARRFIRDFNFPPEVPQELVDTYLATLDQVAELKQRKPDMESDAYFAELENLLVRAAKTNREIRRLSKTAADS